MKIDGIEVVEGCRILVNSHHALWKRILHFMRLKKLERHTIYIVTSVTEERLGEGSLAECRQSVKENTDATNNQKCDSSAPTKDGELS